MNFMRGMRDRVSKYADVNSEICIEMNMAGPGVYDFCCFGIDRFGKLSDDRYMVFYNQTSSPNNEIVFAGEKNKAKFCIQLSKLPLHIEKLVFTVNIDGAGTMGEITNHGLYLSQNNQPQISMELSGSEFRTEKAIISVELYRKDGEWRISAVANGFNGGLSALLASFGGVEASANPSQTEPASSIQNNQPNPDIKREKSEAELTQEVMGKISLSKDKVNLEKHVVNLSKCMVNLSKKSGVDLGSARAKVVVALDFSGSMNKLYTKGTVQHTLDRLVPLGLAFDDNGSIDVYLFQNDFRKLPDLNLSNYENYVGNVIAASGYSMGGTCYSPVLQAIIEGGTYIVQGGFLGRNRAMITTEAIVDHGTPTFILFITDGENSDKHETDAIIRRSSEKNVFIQFIGIGNEKFKYLEKLDDMRGRKRDNTGFSKMKDLDKADDKELYTTVLKQFSKWLKGLQ